MTVMSRLAGRLAKLPPAETYDVLVERDLKVPMPDGVVLLADRYVPRGADQLIYHDPDHPSRITFSVFPGWEDRRSSNQVCSSLALLKLHVPVKPAARQKSLMS